VFIDKISSEDVFLPVLENNSDAGWLVFSEDLIKQVGAWIDISIRHVRIAFFWLLTGGAEVDGTVQEVSDAALLMFVIRLKLLR
jgi:hypothetical protein